MYAPCCQTEEELRQVREWMSSIRVNSTYDVVATDDQAVVTAAGPDATPQQVQTARQARLQRIIQKAKYSRAALTHDYDQVLLYA
jgi:hypothetical protein